MGLTKMLATKRWPCRRAASIRLTCPACRLPMVGTKAMRAPALCQARTRSRTALMVVTLSILWAVRGAQGGGARLETAPLRPAAGGDVQHVVEHQNLAVGVGARTDADDRHVQLRGDRLAELRRNAFEQHDVRTGRLQTLGFIEQPRGRFALATLDAESAGLVRRLRLEPQVGADRDVVAGQKLDDLGLAAAALELHHLRTALLHESHGVGESQLLGRATP